MRIRVRVNVNLPLCRGRVFTRKNGVKGWVSFKYKRLPNVCYWCGCLNHFNKDCERWVQSNGTLQPKDQEYGPWLRATPLPKHKNSMIVVPSYYETKKEFEAEGRKQESSGSKATTTTVQGGTEGGGINEVQLQNPALKEKQCTCISEINKETDASLDLQPIGVKTRN